MSIKIDLKIFLFLLLFLLTSQIDMYILLMIFACIHELAHLCTGIILGFKPEELKITPIGLQVSFKIKCEEYNQRIINGNSLGIKKTVIASAGPIINFLIVVLCIIFGKLVILNPQNSLILNIIYANFLIGIFNLLPIYPLDGGRIVNEILHIFIGLKESYQYTHIISKVTVIVLTMISSVVILYLQNIAIIIILAYLWIIVIRENRKYQMRKEIETLCKYYKKACKMDKTMIK